MALLTHNLICKYSGLRVGQLQFNTVAGAVPYLMQWSELVPLHPVFSMSYGKLLDFSRAEWNRLAARTINEELTQDESDILCVSYLALLHKLDCIKQDCVALPPLHIVQNTVQQLFHLAYWKFHLESLRFRFPTYHIHPYNNNLTFQDIGAYLDTCFEVKKSYETETNEKAEKYKIQAAEEALKKLKGEWVTPVSKKLLWKWIRAHLPSSYQPDAEGWLGTIFLGSNSTILDFEEEDINLAEEIIQAECPAGTGVMFAVRARLTHIRDIWETRYKSFDIVLEDQDKRIGVLVNGVQMAIPDPGPAPIAADYPTKGSLIKATAQWQIAKAAHAKYLKGISSVQHHEL